MPTACRCVPIFRNNILYSLEIPSKILHNHSMRSGKKYWFKNGRPIVSSFHPDRRHVVSSTQEYIDDYIDKHHNGNLSLRKTNVTSLGGLVSVDGYLDISQTNITSLGNLESVGKNLLVNGVGLTSLGNLESVGGNIFCTEGSVTHKLLMNGKFRKKVRVGFEPQLQYI